MDRRLRCRQLCAVHVDDRLVRRLLRLYCQLLHLRYRHERDASSKPSSALSCRLVRLDHQKLRLLLCKLRDHLRLECYVLGLLLPHEALVLAPLPCHERYVLRCVRCLERRLLGVSRHGHCGSQRDVQRSFLCLLCHAGRVDRRLRCRQLCAVHVDDRLICLLLRLYCQLLHLRDRKECHAHSLPHCAPRHRLLCLLRQSHRLLLCQVTDKLRLLRNELALLLGHLLLVLLLESFDLSPMLLF